METKIPRQGVGCGGLLETFLGGMETSQRKSARPEVGRLETFLGGMETIIVTVIFSPFSGP